MALITIIDRLENIGEDWVVACSAWPPHMFSLIADTGPNCFQCLTSAPLQPGIDDAVYRIVRTGRSEASG